MDGELFDADDFVLFVSENGQPVQWRKSAKCPCLDLKTGGARADCPVCAGEAYIWDAAKQYTMLLMGFDESRMREQYGDMQHGDAVLTIAPYELDRTKSPFRQTACAAYEGIGEFDSIIGLVGTHRRDEVLVRGGNEKLKAQVPVAVQAIFDVATGARRNWAYRTDFTIVDRTVTWVSGHGPDENVQYSITYTARVEYVVVRDLANLRAHQGGKALPRKVHLRLADLFWAGHGGEP